MNTQCIIIDDEPLAINVIRTHVSKFEFIEIVAECKNAMQAVNILKDRHIDLMFLDINMPNITGLDFLKSLPNAPYVIITTAYREYALEGFDLNVVDYLLKPISFERFTKAVNKFCERQNKSVAKNVPKAELVEVPTIIHVQDGKITYKIRLDNILYLEGFGEYVKVHTPEKVYLSRKTMVDYETQLPGNQFVRIHKSYLVSIAQIVGFTATTVLVNGHELPIGRTYRTSVQDALGSGKEGSVEID